jgi:hypothetical protein
MRHQRPFLDRVTKPRDESARAVKPLFPMRGGEWLQPEFRACRGEVEDRDKRGAKTRFDRGWRAVDREGEFLEAAVTSKRDKAAAPKLLKHPSAGRQP